MVYTITRNDFYNDLKNSTVFTPAEVAKFIYDTVSPVHTDRNSIIFDPAVGEGALLRPWNENGYETMGGDVNDHGYPNTLVADYMAYDPGELPEPGMVIMNPPFNIDEKSLSTAKRFKPKGRPLMPEEFLRQTVRLWGMEIPIIMVAPYGVRLNCNSNSDRRRDFINGMYPDIQSIITLPRDTFRRGNGSVVLFHCEILIFNLVGLKPHYWFSVGDPKLLTRK